MSEQRKIRVAVVFGGRSAEHAVSCASARKATCASGSGTVDSCTRGDGASALRTYPFVVCVSGPSYGTRPHRSS